MLAVLGQFPYLVNFLLGHECEVTSMKGEPEKGGDAAGIEGVPMKAGVG